MHALINVFEADTELSKCEAFPCSQDSNKTTEHERLHESCGLQKRERRTQTPYDTPQEDQAQGSQ
jgi:hypothetical protein